MPLVIVMCLFSTIAYTVFFEIQNYNILGWMFLPLFISSIVDQNYLALALIGFLVSNLSFTCFAVVLTKTIVVSVFSANLFCY